MKVHVFGFNIFCFSSQERVPSPIHTCRRNFRDSVRGPFTKKVKSLIGVPNVVHVKVHVLSFNKILISSLQHVLTPSYPFRKDFGHKVKGSSPKKLNILIEIP